MNYKRRHELDEANLRSKLSAQRGRGQSLCSLVVGKQVKGVKSRRAGGLIQAHMVEERSVGL